MGLRKEGVYMSLGTSSYMPWAAFRSLGKYMLKAIEGDRACSSTDRKRYKIQENEKDGIVGDGGEFPRLSALHA